MAAPITDADRDLARAATLWLADEMMGDLTDGWFESGAIHDISQSNYESGCAALAHMGVFRALGPSTWHLQVNRSQIAGLIAARDLSQGDIDALMDALACHAGGHLSLFRREHPFPMADRMTRCDELALALYAAGYLCKGAGGGLVWSPRAYPWLVLNHVMPLSAVPPASAGRAQAVLGRLPPDAVALLSRLGASSDFARVFCNRWSDHAGWHDGPDALQTAHQGWDTALAAALHALMHGGSR